MQHLADTLPALIVRTPIPDKYFCPKCHFFVNAGDPALVAWLQVERSDLLSENGSPSSELDCRCLMLVEAEKLAQRDRELQANLPRRDDKFGPRTIGNFESVDGTIGMVDAAQTFLRGEGASLVVLAGVTGCGKTHLAEHVVRTTLAKGASARFERVEAFLDALRATYDGDGDMGLKALLEWYQSFSVLVFDDLGAQKPTHWGVGQLTSFVEQRIIDGGQILFTSNLKNHDEMKEQWGDRLASRLFDKVTGATKVVLSEAHDYRRGS